MDWDDPMLEYKTATDASQQKDLVDIPVSEANAAVNQTQSSQVPGEGSMETPAFGKRFGGAATLWSNLKSLGVPIPENMNNIHELRAIGNQEFEQYPSSSDARP